MWRGVAAADTNAADADAADADAADPNADTDVAAASAIEECSFGALVTLLERLAGAEPSFRLRCTASLEGIAGDAGAVAMAMAPANTLLAAD